MTDSADGRKADLSSLHDTYEFDKEVGRDGASVEYIARHRDLGRDVVIRVVHVPGGQADDARLHFAEDARLLSTLRHDNVVPVLEGRWVDADHFAVVRVLVRGTTLAQAIASDGPFAPERAAKTLGEITSALDWARRNGVAHRELTANDVCFQQGSGRPMALLGATPQDPATLPDACRDSRDVGELAWSMLAGALYSASPNVQLADRRPDLDPAITTEVNALLGCQAGATPRDPAVLVGMLGAPATVAAAAGTPAVVPATEPVVIVQRSFRMPGAAIAAIVALIAIVAYFAWQRGHEQRVAVTGGDTLTSQGEVGGDVKSAPMNQLPPTVAGQAASAPPVAPPIAPPTSFGNQAYVPTTPMPTPYPPYPTPSSVPPTKPAPAVVRPGATTPMTVMPPIRDTAPPRDTAPAKTDPCASSDAGDQRTCFTAALGKVDVELNRTYGQVIATLRRRANVAEGDEDPASVVQLRAEQRKWLDDRDTECRRRADGPQWATARAACFGELAAQRVRELAQIRDSAPPH